MSRLPGFHGRGVGIGERPALVVVDMSVGFTDPESPLACDLEDVVDAVGRLLVAARRADVQVVYTTVAYDDESKRQGVGVHRQGAGAPDAGGRQPLGRDRPAPGAAAR